MTNSQMYSDERAHNRALDHAHQAMASLDASGKNGKRLELESGAAVTATFYFHQGFRLVLRRENSQVDMLWEIQKTVPDEILDRLAFYRKKLVAHQTTAENRFTFRSFNLLLAALSYDPASCPTPTAPPSTTPSES
jgi:prephenate dehydrogenase